MKRTISIVLSMVMLISCFAGINLTAFAEDIEETGKCGENVTYRYEESWLFIEGTGDMYDYDANENVSPFSSVQNIDTVVIDDGVTSIGSSAFYNCQGLTTVYMSNTVETIKNHAFCACANLCHIDIPNGVTTIEGYVFDSCESLYEVIIPDSVTSVGEGAFEFCYGLSKVTLSNKLTEIGGWLLTGCKSLESVTIPEGATSIGPAAFKGCESITEIVIPEGVTSIGYDAFSYTGIQNIVIPKGVKGIESSTFDTCTSLESITIPNSVTSIDFSALYNCTSLTDIYYDGTQSEWDAIAIDESNNDVLASVTVHVNPTYTFTASVFDSDEVYGPNETVYLEPNTTVKVCFNIVDDLDNYYVPGWDSRNLIENGFQVEYDPEFIDDVAYAVISTNDMTVGTKGTLTVRGFLSTKYDWDNFDWVNTKPDVEFELNFEIATSETEPEQNPPVDNGGQGNGDQEQNNNQQQGGTNTTPNNNPQPPVDNQQAPVLDTATVVQNQAPMTVIETVTIDGETIAPNADGEYVSTKAKKPAVAKTTSAKKAMTVSWKKVAKVSGYEVQYATDKKFKKNKKSVNVKKAKTTKTTVKKLSSKKKYYVRVRTYKTVNGKKVYSGWSKAKVVTVK